MGGKSRFQALERRGRPRSTFPPRLPENEAPQSSQMNIIVYKTPTVRCERDGSQFLRCHQASSKSSTRSNEYEGLQNLAGRRFTAEASSVYRDAHFPRVSSCSMPSTTSNPGKRTNLACRWNSEAASADPARRNQWHAKAHVHDTPRRVPSRSTRDHRPNESLSEDFSDLVTDVSWNFRVEERTKKLSRARPDAADGAWRMAQADRSHPRIPKVRRMLSLPVFSPRPT